MIVSTVVDNYEIGVDTDKKRVIVTSVESDPTELMNVSMEEWNKVEYFVSRAMRSFSE